MTSADSSFHVSVVICTHNPEKLALAKTLEALRQQTLEKHLWELILVDNASDQEFAPSLELLNGFEHAVILKEPNLGLTHARLRGAGAAKGEVIVFVDDDNVLSPIYLETAFQLHQANPNWGAFGGRVTPQYSDPIAEDLKQYEGYFACRNPKEHEVVLTKSHLTCAELGRVAGFLPLGAGMVVCKKAYGDFLSHFSQRKKLFFTDRKGINSLSCGADYDLSLLLLKLNWNVAYSAELTLTHLIAPFRTDARYIANLVFEAKRTWVLLSGLYSACPWKEIHPSSKHLRMLRAYFALSAWQGKQKYIEWVGACGVFQGQSQLKAFRRENHAEIFSLQELQK